MSTVYLIPATTDEPDSLLASKTETLWRRSGIADSFSPHDLTAVKLHVGEPGTTTFVRPTLVAALVRCVSSRGALPFLTDTAVLYRSPRDNGVGHSLVARQHGFTEDAIGAPFIPADGLTGSDAVELPVDGRHFTTVSIASAIAHARSMLVVSHATGHLGTGFGGALKNLGMGCSSRKAKLRQHHGQQPRINPDRCTACATCAQWCPSDAITVDEHAVIDRGRCVGCGECVATCREGAVEFDWRVAGKQLQERIVEHAAAVVEAHRGHLAFVTMAMSITKNCDCVGIAEQPLIPDIGLLASSDPVAIDHAVLDLVKHRSGHSFESKAWPQHDGSIQIRYAEYLGLGSTDYHLVTIS